MQLVGAAAAVHLIYTGSGGGALSRHAAAVACAAGGAGMGRGMVAQDLRRGTSRTPKSLSATRITAQHCSWPPCTPHQGSHAAAAIHQPVAHLPQAPHPLLQVWQRHVAEGDAQVGRLEGGVGGPVCQAQGRQQAKGVCVRACGRTACTRVRAPQEKRAMPARQQPTTPQLPAPRARCPPTCSASRAPAAPRPWLLSAHPRCRWRLQRRGQPGEGRGQGQGVWRLAWARQGQQPALCSQLGREPLPQRLALPQPSAPSTPSRRSQRNMPAAGGSHSARPVRCCGQRRKRQGQGFAVRD